MANKKFCDLCGQHIPVKDETLGGVYENNIFIRIESNDKKFSIQDACDDCITEFRTIFSKFIKEKDAVYTTDEGDKNAR